MKATKKQLAMLRSLRTRKGRRETGLFLVEGVRLCDELLRSDVQAEMVLVASQEASRREIAELADRFRARGTRVGDAPSHYVQRISDTVHSQGIIAAARWQDISLPDLLFGKRSIVVALDRVSDPGNAGTIIRTAAWFGASSVLLGEGCADLLNSKTVRATMGGIFHLPVCRDVKLAEVLDELKRKGFKITAAAAEAETSYSGWAAAAKSVLLLGSEAHGVAAALRNRADQIISIPRLGRGESLNVAVAAGIFLAAIRS